MASLLLFTSRVNVGERVNKGEEEAPALVQKQGQKRLTKKEFNKPEKREDEISWLQPTFFFLPFFFNTSKSFGAS